MLQEEVEFYKLFICTKPKLCKVDSIDDEQANCWYIKLLAKILKLQKNIYQIIKLEK